VTIAIIAGAFGSYVPVFIFEIILASLIPILGMKLAGRIVSKEAVFLVGIFLACEPYSILNSFLLASETSFTFVLLVFTLFLFRYFENSTIRNAVWSGVFLALAMLIKPTVQFLPILVPAGFYLLNRRRVNLEHLKHAIYFLAVCGLILFPWGYRNYKEFGKFGISSQAGFNLYTVLVPTVMAIENGTTYEAERGQAKFENGMTGTDITPSNDKLFAKKAVGILMDHKLALTKSVGISILTFMTHDGMLTVLGYSHVIIPNLLDKPAITLLTTEPMRFFGIIIKYLVTPGALVLFARIIWVSVFLFYLLGVFTYFRKEKFSQLALFVLLLVVYFALITTVNGFGMNARFRMPVNTFILIFSAYGFLLVWRKFLDKVKSRNA
jgi:4-amino-4-deoxy-L-arabinose transferase-like glycosyltransferase